MHTAQNRMLAFLHCAEIWVGPFFSLRTQISPVKPWVGSEVKPDTGWHGVTGLGHLDFLLREQMLEAAV